MRIARNLSIDYFRRSKRMPKITTSDGEDVFRTIQIVEENREDKMIRMQKEQTIRDLIKLLPEEQREVIILRHYAELSFKEISEITQVSINTALGRMRYALNNLRKLISEKSLSLQ
jgi:RNA polymerase sigma-70 factor (ECF subfamily)